jgi:hypothetical protein
MPKSLTISGPSAATAAITHTVNYAKNPSFEVNVTDDWLFSDGGGGGTRNWDATQYKIGTHSCRLRAGTAGVQVYQPAGSGVSVPDGATVTASAWVRCSADPTPNKASIYLYDFTTPANRGFAYATVASNGTWEYLTVSWTNATGVAKNCIMACYQLFNDSATDVWFDACQLELAPAATPYCDGSLGTHYSWDGAAHNSVSRHVTPAGALSGYTRNLRPSAGPSNALAEAGTFSGYSHKIRGLGGFWRCSFVWHDELPVLMEMMAEGWVRDIRVMGERGMETWEGFVAGMELSITGGMPALKVTGYGYYCTLFWRVYNQTASGHVDAIISAEVATIVTAVGPLIASQAVDVNASLVDRYHDADRFAGDILFDMCAAGNSQNHRFLIGCYEDRQLRFREIALYQTY